uniref:NAC transcription factor 26 n=1 Tax=Litchi chinensis TaxID=151069 RepID=A0A8K1HZZ5_LITCN|nr:NAC transcription factor 26 [Litchi chinensis]
MVSHECFRFQPTDEELVSLLEKKRLDPAFDHPIIKELNIYKCHPRELIGLSSMSDEQVSYVFCTLDPKSDKGKLKNRKAMGGSWKITCRGKKIMAKNSNKQIGVRRTLSFYEGSATKKENWTDYKMYEYHEYPRKDNSSLQGEVVVCRVEKKPNKKHKSSSALDEGQTSNSFAYDSGNNVSEDTLQVEPQLPQNLHLPSSYNNDVANSNLMEVETHPPPNHHLFHVTKDIIQELEAQLPSNQYISSSGEDDTAKCVVPEMESQLLPNQYMYLLIGDYVAKYSFPVMETQLLPNQHMSSNFEDYVAKSASSEIESQLLANHPLSSNIENNAAKSLLSEVRSLDPTQQDELVVCNGLDHNSFATLQSPLYITLGSSYSSTFTLVITRPMGCMFSTLQPDLSDLSGFSNYSTNGLDHNSFSALQFPIRPLQEFSYSVNGLNHISTGQSRVYTPPGSSYSSTFSNDLDPLLNQNSLSALQSPFHQPPGCLYYGSSSNNSTNGLHPNFFSTLQPELSDLSGCSNCSTNGLDHNSFSARQFPIRPLPEFSYSVNGLNHISTGQSPVYTPPGSSYSSWFSNDSNVWTPQFAAEQEDDLANSHRPVQEDFHKLY